MSELNPVKALRALLPRPIPIPELGIEVRPLTLAVHAILDEIDSPLVRKAGTVPSTPFALLPSLYVLTHDPIDVLAGMTGENLLKTALKWADELPPDALGKIDRAARIQIAAFLDVAPTAKKETGTRPTTDGSPHSPSSPPTPTAGPSTPSSSASPPAPSPC